MRRSLVAGALVGAALLLVLDAVATRLGFAGGAIPALPGTALWTTSRAAGVTAFVALALDVLFGLFVSTGVADRWIPRARSVEVHRWLSTVGLSLVAVHALVLLGDRFVRFDALDALVPFLSSYRPFAVGLGVLAAHGMLVVHLSFGLRKRLGARTWRKLHFLSFAVFALALAHGLLAGSDGGAAPLRALYLVAAGLVAALVALRALRPKPRPGARAARHA